MFAIGLDLGQKRDHTAIVVVERQRRHRYLVGPDKELLVRAAERLPLGMAYGEIVEVVRHVVRVLSVQLGPQEVCKLAVDATGVGKPVVDALREAQLGCSMTAVTITRGDKQHYRSGEGSAMNVPKQNLIAGLQLALDQGELRMMRNLRTSHLFNAAVGAGSGGVADCGEDGGGGDVAAGVTGCADAAAGGGWGADWGGGGWGAA